MINTHYIIPTNNEPTNTHLTYLKVVRWWFSIHAAEGGEGRWDLALEVMMCLERHGQQGLQGTRVGPKEGLPTNIRL